MGDVVISRIHIGAGINVKGTAGDSKIVAGIAGRNLNKASAFSNNKVTVVNNDFLCVTCIYTCIEEREIFHSSVARENAVAGPNNKPPNRPSALKGGKHGAAGGKYLPQQKRKIGAALHRV